MKKTAGRKLYSLKETYRITYQAFRSIKAFKAAKGDGILSDPFIERIMLAVTEVNGCEVCSFAHTKMALEAGLSNEEIESMLAGVMGDAPTDEMPAIMFAQHYADLRGRPSKKSWHRILEIYGLPKAKAILGTIRVIMMGNAYGVPWSSFFNRFKGKADERSSLFYEIEMIASTFIFIPSALIHTFLTKKSNRH